MSKITDFFKTVGRIFASPFNKVLGTGMTQAQYEQNEWNAYEAAQNRDFQSNEALLQRNWSSAEAERARDWQEEMYVKYNSLPGKVAQARDAGVNPMFAVTGNSVTPAPTSTSIPSGASASGSAAAGSLSATDSFVNLIGQLIGAQKVQSEIAVNESIAQKNVADAEVSLKKLAYEVANLNSQTELNLQKVLESATSIDKIKSDMNLNDHQAKVFAAQVNYLDAQANYINAIKEPEERLKKAQALIAEWQEQNKELFKGLDIGTDVLNVLTNLGIGIFNAKTGRIFADSPVVVPKDAQVFKPSSIVD